MRRSTRHYLVTAPIVAACLLSVCLLSVCLLSVWRWRPLRRVEVTGGSMLPALAPGDRLLVLRTGRQRVGDVVAVADPRDRARTLVKRVAATGTAGVTVLGDNGAASTDSRVLGPVAPASIRGRAVYRYFPDSRRGRL